MTEFEQIKGGAKFCRQRPKTYQISPVDQQSALTSSNENAGQKRFVDYFRYVESVCFGL